MNKQEEKVVQFAGNVIYPNEQDLGLTNVKEDVTVAYATWIRTLLQNWRQGTVKTKTRSELAFSNKKPWKQKGTGRARVGSIRSPLWRKGGVIFGPQPRVHTLRVTKQAKADVMKALFAEFIKSKRLLVLDIDLNTQAVSTKAVYAMFEQIGIANKKINFFITRDDVNTWLSIRNLENVAISSFDDMNAYDVSKVEYMVVCKNNLESLKEMVAQWN